MVDQGFAPGSPGYELNVTRTEQQQANLQSARAQTATARGVLEAARGGVKGEAAGPVGPDVELQQIIVNSMIWPDEAKPHGVHQRHRGADCADEEAHLQSGQARASGRDRGHGWLKLLRAGPVASASSGAAGTTRSVRLAAARASVAPIRRVEPLTGAWLDSREEATPTPRPERQLQEATFRHRLR